MTDMSYVVVTQELMEMAAGDLATIGETLNAAHMSAAAPTVAVPPAAADEVSTGIAHLMSGYGQEYQALAGQAAAFHALFVQTLTTSAASYANAEDAISALLRPLLAGVGGYLLGGVGKPGLLPLIAFEIVSNSTGSHPFSALGLFETPQTHFLIYQLGNALNVLFIPIDLLLIPWVLVYFVETSQFG